MTWQERRSKLRLYESLSVLFSASDNAHTEPFLSMADAANARVLSGFLDYLRIEKGLARLSIAAYTTDITQFAEFLEKRKRHLLNARRNDVREFLQQLFSNQVDGRSVGRKLSALRHLYRYLLLDKKIDHDPTLNIESPRQWKVLPKSLAKDEIEATLAAPAKAQTSRSNSLALALRDSAMLELLYAGALRVSELTTATLEDLKLEAGYMLVRGKGDKERIVPLGKAGAGFAGGVSGERPSATGAASRQGCEEWSCCRQNAVSLHRKRRAKVNAATYMADGGTGLCCVGAARVAAYAAALLCNAHG